jgi:hypothetical protein
MPTPTYTALANITLGSSASSVTFSSIPATYRDLVIVVSGVSSGTTWFGFRFNSDTGSNYSNVWMQANADGAAPISGSNSTTNIMPWEANVLQASTPFTITTQVMDYSATDKHKTTLSRTGGSVGGVGLMTSAGAGRWANTAAITTVAAVASGGSLGAGLTFALYGIAS